MIFFDVEAAGLLHAWQNEWGEPCKEIYCVCTKRGEEEITWEHPFTGLEEYLNSDIICGHNIISYDIPVLERVLGINITSKRVDTLILSRLMNPDRFGKQHSLEAWGRHLGDWKGDFKPDSWLGLEVTEEMVEYCKQDVRLTEKVYKELVKKAKGWDWKAAYDLEVAVQKVIDRATDYGTGFNKELAEDTLTKLDKLMGDIEARVEPLLPNRPLKAGEIKNFTPPATQFKKDGSYSKYMVDFANRVGAVLSGRTITFNGKCFDLPCNECILTEAKMSLRLDMGDVKDWLMREHGWDPMYWNTSTTRKDENGKPAITSPKFRKDDDICPSLQRLAKKLPLVNDLIYYDTYKHRRSSIKSIANDTGGMLNHCRLSHDGRLPFSPVCIGTNTCRMSHRAPIANVPKPSKIFGKEMRGLFCAPEGRFVVGWDASGLEARVEAHYTYPFDDGRYANELLEGDIHANNAKVFGTSRDDAKAPKYLLTYGGQAPALAKTLGIPVGKAKKIWDNFWNTNTSLKDFRDRLTNYWNNTGGRKFIKGLDGRKINTRSEHSLVNCAFQSAGIIIMKRALVIWESWVRDKGLDAETVLHVHDEQQVEVASSLVERIPVKFEFLGDESEKEAKEKAENYRLQYEEEHGRILSAPLKYGNAYYLVYCEVGELGVKSIREAGEFYGIRVPMDAEYKVGRDWSSTH